jgi:hypothetical protein
MTEFRTDKTLVILQQACINITATNYNTIHWKPVPANQDLSSNAFIQAFDLLPFPVCLARNADWWFTAGYG